MTFQNMTLRIICKASAVVLQYFHQYFVGEQTKAPTRDSLQQDITKGAVTDQNKGPFANYVTI